VENIVGERVQERDDIAHLLLGHASTRLKSALRLAAATPPAIGNVGIAAAALVIVPEHVLECGEGTGVHAGRGEAHVAQ
jgi:hypothetical protein